MWPARAAALGFVLIIASACGHSAGVDRVQGGRQELTLAADGQPRARVAENFNPRTGEAQ
jgi:hypothetical protein